MSGTPIHDEVVRDLAQQHLIRFNKRGGWRCTCGEHVRAWVGSYSRETAETHAFNVSGRIELAGAVAR